MTVPKHFFLYQNKLALFHHYESTKEYWCKLWERSNAELQRNIDEFKKNYKSIPLGKILSGYLPRQKRILEAGCGWGKYVAGLQAQGYVIEGVDFEEKTIERLNRVAPDLKINKGDIYHLSVPDKYFGAYISIGVFEHQPSRLAEGLKEAIRVLEDNGIACISVPLENKARAKLKKKVPLAHSAKLESGLTFYQCYYSIEEFQRELGLCGFHIIKTEPYGVYTGMIRDFAFAEWMDRHLHWRIRRLLNIATERFPFKLKKLFAHMVMFVCIKRS